MAWQFVAEDPTVLAAGFGELAAQLGAQDVLDQAGPGGVGTRSARRVPGPVAAAVRQCAGPRLGAGVPSSGRERAGADHQPEPAVAPGPGRGSPGPWYRGGRGVPGWPQRRPGPAGRRAISPGSWAGCRWRWSRPPRTCRPPGTAWPGTWHRSGIGGWTCSVAESLPNMASRSRPPGRWRSPGWSSRLPWRSACCGCWLSARPTRSRCGCSCGSGPGSPATGPAGGSSTGTVAGG